MRMAFMRTAYCHFVASLLCGFVWVSGCTHEDLSGNRFLLPWLNSDGSYSLQEIEITSLNSPFSVSGPVARVYANAPFGHNGFLGEPARTELSFANGIFVPTNVLSSLALSVYAHFERLWELDRTLEAGDFLPWPRQAGIDVPISNKEGGLEFDNAQYYSHYDLTVVLPYKIGGLPMAANGGIIAHEHFHAHFNHLVLRPLQIEYWEDLEQEQEFNRHVVIRGWNEGLADYYAFIYTKDPHFMSESFINGAAFSRDLTHSPRAMESNENQWRRYTQIVSQGGRMGNMVYDVGSEVARLLYDLGQSSEFTHSQIMTHVFGRLRQMPEWLIKVQKIRSQKLSTHSLVDFLFNEQRWLSEDVCGIFQRHFQLEDMKELEISKECL